MHVNIFKHTYVQEHNITNYDPVLNLFFQLIFLWFKYVIRSFSDLIKNCKCGIRNNAGRLAHEHAISEDGIEMTFATNYLGNYFVLI